MFSGSLWIAQFPARSAEMKHAQESSACEICPEGFPPRGRIAFVHSLFNAYMGPVHSFSRAGLQKFFS